MSVLFAIFVATCSGSMFVVVNLVMFGLILFVAMHLRRKFRSETNYPRTFLKCSLLSPSCSGAPHRREFALLSLSACFLSIHVVWTSNTRRIHCRHYESTIPKQFSRIRWKSAKMCKSVPKGHASLISSIVTDTISSNFPFPKLFFLNLVSIHANRGKQEISAFAVTSAKLLQNCLRTDLK